MTHSAIRHAHFSTLRALFLGALALGLTLALACSKPPKPKELVDFEALRISKDAERLKAYENDEVRQLLEESEAFYSIAIEKYDDEDLFDVKQFSWMGIMKFRTAKALLARTDARQRMSEANDKYARNQDVRNEYNDNLVHKVFIFIFVDGFLWFWIMGYVHIPILMGKTHEELLAMEIPMFGKAFPDPDPWTGHTLDQIADIAADAPAGADGVLFHPYLLGERAPHWSPDLTASFTGMTRATNQSHLARAVFEGIGHALTQIWHSMDIAASEATVLGGGAQSAFWCQMIADMTGAVLRVPEHTDASFGAALLAAHADGAFDTLATAAEAGFHKRAEFSPDKQAHACYIASHEVYRAAFEQFHRQT